MSATRLLSHLSLRRGVALSPSKTSSPATRFPSAIRSSRHYTTTSYPATLVPALTKIPARCGRLSTNQIARSSRWISSTVPAATNDRGVTGEKGMKVAIIGQSLFGKEVHKFANYVKCTHTMMHTYIHCYSNSSITMHCLHCQVN